MVAAVRSHVLASETGASAFAVSIAVGEHELIGDEPVAAGGLGLGPNPFELLSASLAECTAMTVRWFAINEGWPVEHVEVVVDHAKKVLVGTTVPVDVFEKTVLIRGELTERQRARLLDVAGRCPVQRVLEGSPLINTKAAMPILNL